MLNVTVTLCNCVLPSMFEFWYVFATFACLFDPVFSFWMYIWNIQWRWSLYIPILCGLLSCDSISICKKCCHVFAHHYTHDENLERPMFYELFLLPKCFSLCWGIFRWASEWYHNEYKGWMMFPKVTVPLVNMICNITYQISLMWMPQIERRNTVLLNLINWSK